MFVIYFCFFGDASSIETETIRETSISTPLSEHQLLRMGTASRITNLISESDSQNLDNNDERIIETSKYCELSLKKEIFCQTEKFL